jgi:hypothetical protein
MLKHGRAIVAAIVRRFRSRAVLELENLIGFAGGLLQARRIRG